MDNLSEKEKETLLKALSLLEKSCQDNIRYGIRKIEHSKILTTVFELQEKIK